MCYHRMRLPTLSYQPRNSAIAMRASRLVALAVVVTLVIAVFPQAKRLWRGVLLVKLQRDCVAGQARPGELVYEERPAAAARLLASDRRFARERPSPLFATFDVSPTPVAVLQNPCWPDLQARVPGYASVGTGATLFAGWLTSTGGTRRFVVIEAWCWGQSNLWVETCTMPCG